MIRQIFDKEPIVLYGLVNAVLIALTTFGLEMSEAEIGAILMVVNAVLVFAGRQSVVPVVTADQKVQEALYKQPPRQPELTVAQEPIVDASLASPQPQGEEKPAS